MGNSFAKSDISLKLKNPKASYKPGEHIDLIVEFQSSRVFKDAEIKIVFKGIQQHQDLFSVHKILSVGKWNNKASIHQTHEISFDIASPIDISPSKEDVYVVEAKLEALGHLWPSTRAETFINIPLAV